MVTIIRNLEYMLYAQRTTKENTSLCGQEQRSWKIYRRDTTMTKNNRGTVQPKELHSSHSLSGADTRGGGGCCGPSNVSTYEAVDVRSGDCFPSTLDRRRRSLVLTNTSACRPEGSE